MDAAYSYRRPLRIREMLPAIGVAIGAGLVTFYLARLLLQRTRLGSVRQASARISPDAREPAARS